MDIYLLRHGETNSNKDNKFYGSLDTPLNDIGKSQIVNIRPHLSKVKFDVVYSSTLQRAKESVALLGEDIYEKNIADKRLDELSFGKFEGLSYNEILSRYPKEAIKWEKDWKGYTPPKGESYIDFYNRVRECFKEILKTEADNVLVATHMGVIKSIFCYVLGEDLDLFWKLTAHNGKYSVIKYEYNNLFIDCINKGDI